MFLDVTPELPASWLLNPGGITVLAAVLFFLAALWRGWIVPGWLYLQEKSRADALQAAADKYLEEYRNREREERKEHALQRRLHGGDS